MLNPYQVQNVGTKLKIWCSTQQGSLPLSFLWLKDSRLIHDQRVKIDLFDEESTLHIHHLVPGDSGNYSCKASNEAGFDSQFTAVTVQGLWEFRFANVSPSVCVSSSSFACKTTCGAYFARAPSGFLFSFYVWFFSCQSAFTLMKHESLHQLVPPNLITWFDCLTR